MNPAMYIYTISSIFKMSRKYSSFSCFNRNLEIEKQGNFLATLINYILREEKVGHLKQAVMAPKRLLPCLHMVEE